MREPYATDYSDDVAFELFVLEKGVPLLDTTQSASAEFDIANDKLIVNMMVSDSLGRTLPQAMEEMGVRPLLFGSAWKCLDILVEYAFDEAGLSPSRGRRWLIAEKVHHAQAGAGRAEPLSSTPGVWMGVCAAYAALYDVRHALTHRRAHLDANGDLVGTDATANPLTPVTREQQDSLIRIAQRVVKAISSGTLDRRHELALLGELDVLAPLTGQPLSGQPLVRHPASRMRLLVSEGQELDLTAIKARLRPIFGGVVFIDLEFICDGQSYLVDIDHVPDGPAVFDPTALTWLS